MDTLYLIKITIDSMVYGTPPQKPAVSIWC